MEECMKEQGPYKYYICYYNKCLEVGDLKKNNE